MRLTVFAGLALLFVSASLPAFAQVPNPVRRTVAPAVKPVESRQLMGVHRMLRRRWRTRRKSKRINAWTVGLAAGRIEGAPLQFASELARVLDDGDNMRVLPIVTRGPFDNVYDLLYLRGVDAAIVYGDVLDHFKNQARVRRRLAAHQLSAEPVSVGGARVRATRDQLTAGSRRQGGQLQYARARPPTSPGPIIFKQLGIDVKATFMPAQRRHGEDEDRATRSPPPSGSRPSRSRHS